MNDSNNLYKPPESKLEGGQNIAQKNEIKILKDICKLLRNEEKYIAQRTLMVSAFMIFSVLSVIFLLFVYFQEMEIQPMHLAIGVLSGLLFGLGLWLVSFLNTWPILKKYFRKEAILKRYDEISK